MWRYKTWKRTVVLAAGSATHFILGFVVLYLMAVSMGLPNAMIGKPQISAVANCVHNATIDQQVVDPTCQPGDPAPAKNGGLRPGDEIVSVAGTSTPTYADVTAKIQPMSGAVDVVVRRAGNLVPLTIDVVQVDRPVTDPANPKGAPKIVKLGTIGVTFPSTLNYNPVTAFGGAGSFTAVMFTRTWDGLLAFPDRRHRGQPHWRRGGPGWAVVAVPAPAGQSELLHRRVQPAAAAAAGRRPYRGHLVRAGPRLAARAAREGRRRAGGLHQALSGDHGRCVHRRGGNPAHRHG
jgi:membrane-associated protease RseP (regulator of RpoE activity)